MLTFSLINQPRVPFTPRRQLRVGVLPILLSSVLVDLPSIEGCDVKVDAASSIRVGESTLLDLLDEPNDLRDVLRDASDGVSRKDVESSHVFVESVFPEGGKVSGYRGSSEKVTVLEIREEERSQRGRERGGERRRERTFLSRITLRGSETPLMSWWAISREVSPLANEDSADLMEARATVWKGDREGSAHEEGEREEESSNSPRPSSTC